MWLILLIGISKPLSLPSQYLRMLSFSTLLLSLQIGVGSFAFVVDHKPRICPRPNYGQHTSISRPAAKKGDGKDDGYKFGDISRGIANRFTKRVEQVTGKDYEFGDLTRHLDKTAKEKVSDITGKSQYEFGDLSRWADAKVKEKVCEMTGKTDYKVGDISKEILRRVLAGEVKWDEVLMLMKVLLSVGASFSPVAGALPAKVLIDLLNYSIATQVGEKVTGAIATELDRRMKKAVTGNPEYQLGDISKAQMLKFIGKDEYSFGDLTSRVMEKMNDANKEGAKGRSDMLFGDSDTESGKEEKATGLELTNEQILAELAAWDKAFKVDEEGKKSREK